MKNYVSKGILLGNDPHTTRSLIYYRVDTYRIKLASYVQFDEGMNDLFMEDTPLNVQHLHRVNNVKPLPEEQNFPPAINFELYICPFTELLPMLLNSTLSSPDPYFGFTLQDYGILKRAFVKTIRPKYPYSKIFSNPGTTNNNMRGDFSTSIHGTRVFTSSDYLKHLCLLHKQGVL